MAGTTDPEGLLPKREMDSPEGMAQALVWTMNNLLPWYVPAPIAGTYVFRSEEIRTVSASHRQQATTCRKLILLKTW